MGRNEHLPFDNPTYKIIAYKGPFVNIAAVNIKYTRGESGDFAFVQDKEAFVYWNVEFKTWKYLGVNKSDLVNNLTSDDITKGLAAPQGKALKALIDALSLEKVDKDGDKTLIAPDKLALIDTNKTNIDNEVIARVNADIDLNSRIDSASSGFIDGISPLASAPTPGKSGYYEFSADGTYPSWIEPTSGVTSVHAGDRVYVNYTTPSTYTYKWGSVNLGNTFQSKSDSNLITNNKTIVSSINEIVDVTLNESSEYSIGQSNISDTQFANGTRLLDSATNFLFRVKKVTIFSGGNGNFDLNEYSKNQNGTFKFIKKIIYIGSLHSGQNVFNIDTVVGYGHFIGISCNNGIIGFNETGGKTAITLESETGTSIVASNSNITLNIKLDGEGIGLNLLSAKNKNIENLNILSGVLTEGNNIQSIGYFNLSDNNDGGGLRGHNQPAIGNIRVTKLNINAVTNTSLNIYELERHADGTFGYKSLLWSGTLYDNGYFDVDFIIHNGCYVGWNVISGTIRYNSTGSQSSFTFSNALTDTKNSVICENYQWGVQLIGNTIGVNTALSKIEDVYNGKTYHWGNEYNNNKNTWNYSSGGQTQFVIVNDKSFAYSGVLNKIYVKATIAGMCDLYKAKFNIAANNWDIKGLIASVNLSVGVNEIETYVHVNKGEYLAIYLPYGSASIGWNENGTCYTNNSGILGNAVTCATRAAGMCIAAEIDIIGLEECKNTINTNLKNGGYLIDASLQTSDFIVANGSWNGFTSSTANSLIYVNKPTGMDKQIIRIIIKLTDVSLKTAICGYAGGQYVVFDFANKIIKLHKQWDGNIAASEPDVLVTLPMFDTIVVNRNYILELESDTTKILKVRLIDCFTLLVKEIVHTTTSDENATIMPNYPCGILLRNGSITVKRVSQYSKQYTSPTLMLYGDSYMQGFNLIRYGEDSDNCYSHLIKSAFNNNVSISARGGESTVGLLTKMQTDFELFKPKYTLLAIGLNDAIVNNRTLDDFKINMSKLINAARKYGSEVILVTYPRLVGEQIGQYNSWIRNYNLGFRYLDISTLLSTDEVNEIPDQTNYFLPDGHPNTIGNERIFNAFMLYFSDILADNN